MQSTDVVYASKREWVFDLESGKGFVTSGFLANEKVNSPEWVITNVFIHEELNELVNSRSKRRRLSVGFEFVKTFFGFFDFSPIEIPSHIGHSRHMDYFSV